jgi:hypothetical protein
MRARAVAIGAMMRLIDLTDYIVPHTIRAVAELGVADHLTGGPRPVGELAAATGADEASLLRALRALACNGIFTEEPVGTFGLTPPADLLRGDHPYSMRDALALRPAELYAWAGYHETMRTGAPAYPRVHGTPAPDPAPIGRADAESLGAAYPWTELGRLVDAGGAAELIALLPAPRGSGPAGHLLVRTLCALSDEDAAARLGRIRAGMGDGDRVLVVEPVAEPGEGALEDLYHLVFTGGRLRTPAETGDLFEAAGLRTVAVHRAARIPIVEAAPHPTEGLACR